MKLLRSRCLRAALLVGFFGSLSGCGHYGAPLRTQPPPPGSPPDTPGVAIPSLPEKAVPPPYRTPTPMDDESEGWTP